MRFPPFRGTRPTALALLSAVVLGLSCDAQRADERVATTAGAFSIVPTQGGGNYRQQAVVDDALTYAAVSSPQFRHLVTLPVEGNIYAQPLATTIVRSGHTVPVVLVATTENLLYAFEGERPYQELWPRISFGRPADFLGSLPYAQNYNNDVCRSNVGRVGILSTPVISGGFVYLIAETEESSTNLAHTMYKVRMDGTIAASQRISATGANRSVFQSNLQLQRPGLLASNGVIYAAFGSHCDVDLDDFRGWVLAFDDGDLHQLATYCTTCQAAGGRFPYESRGGIWQSGSGLATDRDGNVLFMVGNGKSAPDDPGNTGTSIVSLNTAAVRAGTLDVHTFFTPADEFYETKIDADLGSSGPVYVPDGNLVYGGGKTGTLFLLDAANFGGFHNVTNSQIRGQTQASCNLADHLQPVACTTLDPPIEMEPDAAVYGHIHGTPPYWADHHRLFVWGQGDYPRWKDIDTGARRFSGGTGVNPHRPFGASAGGTGGLLSLSTNSHGEAILWATWRFPGSLDTFGFSERVNQYRGIPTGETGDGLFVALQGDSLLQLSAAFPIRGQAKMTAPLVANGKVYVATQAGGVMVYGIDGDADGDGWPDGPDNCPDVYNADQTDTNLEAELIVAARDGVVCSDGTRPPGAPVGPVEESRTTIVGDLFYAGCFHSYFPGDACDKNATTQIKTESVVLRVPPPCTIPMCVWNQTTGTFDCTQAPPTTCEETTNAGIRFDSWIGSPDPFHPAPQASGTSNPARCPCAIQPAPGENPKHELVRRCRRVFACDIGADDQFPEMGIPQSFRWGAVPLAVSPLTPSDVNIAGYVVPMIHQQPPIAIAEEKPQHFLWQFPDGSGANLLWGHVDTFTAGAGEAQPDPALKHDYQWLSPSRFKRPTMRFNGARVPFTWIPFGWSPAPSIAAPPRWLALALADGATFPIAQDGRAPAFVGTEFAADALAALLPVAQGKAELLIGDDVVWGMPFRSAVMPAVIVQPGTTTLIGALQATDGAIRSLSKCVSTSGLCDPPGPRPDLRALDAWDGTLFSIHVSTGGASLTRIDVRSALLNEPPARSALTTDVFGAVPVAPMAMAWHFAERALYVLDAVPVAGRRSALRLLRLETSGRSAELWRTRGVGSLPAGFVSVDLRGDIVVSLRADAAEFAAVGRTGTPRVSKHVDGRLKQAAVGAMTGFSMPLDAHAHGVSSDLRVEFVSEKHTTPGICGAPWLRAHADDATRNPLSVAAAACRERDDEDDNEHRDEH